MTDWFINHQSLYLQVELHTLLDYNTVFRITSIKLGDLYTLNQLSILKSTTCSTDTLDHRVMALWLCFDKVVHQYSCLFHFSATMTGIPRNLNGYFIIMEIMAIIPCCHLFLWLLKQVPVWCFLNWLWPFVGWVV